MSRTDELRARARKLLAEGIVRTVIGYRATGRGPAQPAVITRRDQADLLIFDATCGPNLASYVARAVHNGRVGIVAKGCDSRSLVCLLKEKQFSREDIYVIGTSCEGIMEGGKLSDACTTCTHPNPVISDEMVGEPVKGHDQNGVGHDPLSADDRWQALAADVSRCIRCYACRQVCPNCYCPVCFVDAGMPQWVGKTRDLSDNMVFHLMRALHMAGRCVECGSCSRACPVGIDLMRFNRRVTEIVRDRFQAEVGTDPDQAPALAAFDPNDRQDFIL